MTPRKYMRLSQVWNPELPTSSMSDMSEQQLSDMELGIFVDCAIGVNPETLFIQLEDEATSDDERDQLFELFTR